MPDLWVIQMCRLPVLSEVCCQGRGEKCFGGEQKQLHAPPWIPHHPHLPSNCLSKVCFFGRIVMVVHPSSLAWEQGWAKVAHLRWHSRVPAPPQAKWGDVFSNLAQVCKSQCSAATSVMMAPQRTWSSSQLHTRGLPQLAGARATDNCKKRLHGQTFDGVQNHQGQEVSTMVGSLLKVFAFLL